MKNFKFEELPELVGSLIEGQNTILSLLQKEPQEEKRPLGVDEVSLLIMKSKPTIYRLVQKKTIPHHKISGKLYFFQEELINWIKSGKTVSEQVDDLLTKKK